MQKQTELVCFGGTDTVNLIVLVSDSSRGYYDPSITDSTDVIVRSDSDSGKVRDELENIDNDSVELEKSNVLLMGPTGSGMISDF